MTFKMLAIDLDDTLLTSDKTITEKSRQVIQRAVEQGIKVVLCSGRTHNATIKFAHQLNLSGADQYMITNGGAIIEDLSGKILSKKMMDNAFYREFVAFTHENELGYNVVDEHGRTYTSPSNYVNRYVIMQARENDNGLYLVEPDDLADDFEISKAIIDGEEKQIDSISDLVHQRFDQNYFVVRTGEGYLEIFRPDINKGVGVTGLANYLKIDLKDVMAFGDRDNDIPMFKVAGKAVAMGNAQPQVKDASDYVTEDNNHDGVANAIEKFVLK